MYTSMCCARVLRIAEVCLLRCIVASVACNSSANQLLHMSDGCECWGNAMLGTQVGGARHVVATSLRDVIEVAAVMIL